MTVTTQDRKNMTAQEIRVLPWVAQGKTSWEIGQIMGISERTVTAHVTNIMTKLDAVSRPHLVAKAVAVGIIQIAE